MKSILDLCRELPASEPEIRERARQKRRPTIDDLRATPELWNLEIQQIKDDATIAEHWIICQEADALLDSQITPEAIVELRQKLNVEPVPHPEDRGVPPDRT